ncbi:MAG: DUF5667 domain-containing protein [Eubacteriales bacterium]
MKKITKILFLAVVILLATQPSIFAAVDTTSGASAAPNPAPAPAKPPAQSTPQEPQTIVDMARILTALEATESIMPDSELYSIKLLIEELFADLVTADAPKAELLLDFAGRRTDEAAYLHSIGNDTLALELSKQSVDLLSQVNSTLESAAKTDVDGISDTLLGVSAIGERVVSLLNLMAITFDDDDQLLNAVASAQEQIVHSIVINAAMAVGDVSYDKQSVFDFAMAAYLAALEQKSPDPVQSAFDALVLSGLLEKEPVVQSTPSRYYYDDDDDDDDDHYEYEYEHDDDD